MKQFIKKYIGIFLITIMVQWLIVILLFFLHNDFSPGTPFFDFYKEHHMNSGTDVEHYVYLAENGYQSTGDKINLIVFYPLYPLVIKALYYIVGDYFWSGVIVSTICFGISACLLYELIAIELNKEKATDGVASYILYPFALFLISVFTEGLFMVLSIACLLMIKKRKWFLTGIFGMLAALTKTQGIVLLLPALYEALLEIKKQKKFLPRTMWIILIPFGTFIYLLINKMVLGDFFAFIGHQAAPPWHNKAKWISTNISFHYKYALDLRVWGGTTYGVQFFLYFLGVIAMFFGLRKKISTSFIAYGGAYIFVSYIHGWLFSGARYMMCCIPLYIVYASIENRSIKKILLLIEGMLAVFYVYCFNKGYPVI